MKSSDDTLPLASVHKLTSVSHNITAGMVFDEEGEEEEEEDDNNARANTCKPTGSDINEFTREKPLFSSSVTHPGDCVSLKLCDTAEDKVPYTINRYLRDYQREGIRFIYNNYIHARGCILGDDMGLGKTVQVTARKPIFSTHDQMCTAYLYFILYVVSHLFFIGHWLPRGSITQNRNMGGHSEQQASISAESGPLRAE